MKLYILKPVEGSGPWEPKYDKAHGFVIRARSANDARKIAHEQAGDENHSPACTRPWLDPQYSTCKRLTEAGQVGVILHDYTAG